MSTVSALYLKRIIEACIGRGASAEAIYALLPKGAAMLKNSSLRIDGEIFIDILHSAIRTSGDKDFVLKIGESLRPDSLDDVGYAITFCDNLRDVMRVIAQYQSISQGFGTSKLVVGDKVARIYWTSSHPDTMRYAPYVDLVFSGYATVGRWLLWQSRNPISGVAFQRPEPEDSRAYKAIFGPDVTFGAPQDVMSFEAKLVDVDLPSRNPDIKRLMLERLESQLRHITAAPTTQYRTQRCLTSELHKGRPDISHIAAILGQSERTLRRNLAAEGTSFRDVLTQVYKEACEIHLRNERMSHAQIALALGFGDQTAYSRAFKRWFSVSPEAYRKDIIAQGGRLAPNLPDTLPVSPE